MEISVKSKQAQRVPAKSTPVRQNARGAVKNLGKKIIAKSFKKIVS